MYQKVIWGQRFWTPCTKLRSTERGGKFRPSALLIQVVKMSCSSSATTWHNMYILDPFFISSIVRSQFINGDWIGTNEFRASPLTTISWATSISNLVTHPEQLFLTLYHIRYFKLTHNRYLHVETKINPCIIDVEEKVCFISLHTPFTSIEMILLDDYCSAQVSSFTACHEWNLEKFPSSMLTYTVFWCLLHDSSSLSNGSKPFSSYSPDLADELSCITFW